MKFKPNPLLYGANEDFLSTFRLAIRMKDTVDYDILSRSVEKAIVRYPYFCVSPNMKTRISCCVITTNLCRFF